MKAHLIALLLLFFSCKASQQKNIYEKIVKDGYRNLKYKFSDNGNRGLIIEFSNDSLARVSNHTSIGHNYYLLNFNREYIYQKSRLGVIVIEKLIKSDKSALNNDKYLKPYDNSSYVLDSNATEYVFPDIIGDTIRFSSDFKKLQVREFCFEKTK
jgi:hypothetical protein